MRTLRFPKEVYLGEQVDAATKVYARFGTLETSEDDGHWIVSLTCTTPEREAKLAGELGNYALGLTVRARSAS